jgi:dolichyl-diphosphooligosaccharide--protein glycosyltransferase
MQWLRENTSEDAVIASWWDYGYWISTLGERKTLADNATLIDWQIRKIAAMYMSTPENAWQILMTDEKTYAGKYYDNLPLDTQATNLEERNLEVFGEWRLWDDDHDGIINAEEVDTWWAEGENVCLETTWLCPKFTQNPGTISQYPTVFDYWKSEVYVIEPALTGLDADYVIVNLAVQKLSDENIIGLYVLKQKGGDETKGFWFTKIADLRVLDYYNPELTGFSGEFWDETLLGKLIPFTHILYVDPDDPEIQTETYTPGYTPIYVKNIKFPRDGDGPFQLVYVSPSFKMDAPGPLTGPLIYKINKEYNPNQ